MFETKTYAKNKFIDLKNKQEIEEDMRNMKRLSVFLNRKAEEKRDRLKERLEKLKDSGKVLHNFTS